MRLNGAGDVRLCRWHRQPPLALCQIALITVRTSSRSTLGPSIRCAVTWSTKSMRDTGGADAGEEDEANTCSRKTSCATAAMISAYQNGSVQ